MEHEINQVEDQFSVLVIDDEENMRHMLAHIIGRAGYTIETAGDGEEGLQKLKHTPFTVVLCDIKMPVMDGMSFLRASNELSIAPTIVMMSAYGTIDMAVEAMKMGAYDFISKPFKSDEILLTLKKIEERHNLQLENILLKERIQRIEERHRFGNLVAKATL